MIKINQEILNLINDCQNDCKKEFDNIANIEFYNQQKVLNAFIDSHVQARHFIGSSGYGHNDIGKEKICEVYSKIFNTEASFVSPLISCGTEAISQTLLGLLRPNDCMLTISGSPYDTLKRVIYGVEGEDVGSLKDYGINYHEVDLMNNNFDLPNIISAIKRYNPKLIYIQRSRGYSGRNALNIKQMETAFAEIKKHTNAYIVVDNCYGEFTEIKEPTDVGADVVIGSLLKNIGGGIAPTGGYISGKAKLIEQISYKITSPAVGAGQGSYEPGYKLLFMGLFQANHIVAEAKKMAILTSRVMQKLGYETVPKLGESISDIVCCIKFNDKQKLINFTRAIQTASAVDSDSVLEAGEMDGYEDLIIMASGSFNQGSSIELSCDGPMRAPYSAYLQGSLNLSHGKLALMHAIDQAHLFNQK